MTTTTTTPADLAAQLRTAAEAAGISRNSIAERIGVPASTVCRIFAGTVSPNLETLQKIAGAVGLVVVLVPAKRNRRRPRPPA